MLDLPKGFFHPESMTKINSLRFFFFFAGTKEMKEEQVQFAEFSQFCELTLADKARSIGDATDKIETLEADWQRCWKQILGGLNTCVYIDI